MTLERRTQGLGSGALNAGLQRSTAEGRKTNNDGRASMGRTLDSNGPGVRGQMAALLGWMIWEDYVRSCICVRNKERRPGSRPLPTDGRSRTSRNWSIRLRFPQRAMPQEWNGRNEDIRGTTIGASTATGISRGRARERSTCSATRPPDTVRQ